MVNWEGSARLFLVASPGGDEEALRLRAFKRRLALRTWGAVVLWLLVMGCCEPVVLLLGRLGGIDINEPSAATSVLLGICAVTWIMSTLGMGFALSRGHALWATIPLTAAGSMAWFAGYLVGYWMTPSQTDPSLNDSGVLQVALWPPAAGAILVLLLIGFQWSHARWRRQTSGAHRSTMRRKGHGRAGRAR